MFHFGISTCWFRSCNLVRLFAGASLSVALASAHPEDSDLVVYGGTSGGITAAVAAEKFRKKVELVSPTVHLGGLTASGFGWTDLGKFQAASILGGLRLLHWNPPLNWSLHAPVLSRDDIQQIHIPVRASAPLFVGENFFCLNVMP